MTRFGNILLEAVSLFLCEARGLGEGRSQMADGMNKMAKVTETAPVRAGCGGQAERLLAQRTCPRGRRWADSRPPHRVEALEIERGGPAGAIRTLRGCGL